MIFKSLTFWTLLAGLAAFVLQWYFPTFPFDEVTILAAILFALGLIGVVPQFRAQRALTPPIVNSLAFWQLVAGFLVFILHFFAPSFPFDQLAVLAFLLFVLGFFGIHPELRARGLLPGAPRQFVTTGVASENIQPGDAVYVLPDGTIKKSQGSS